MTNIVINGTAYKFPESITEHNSKLHPDDFYSELTLSKTFTGFEEFTRLDNLGLDYLDEEYCQCWQAYADLHNIDSLDDDRLLIQDVGDTVYALFADYKKEESDLIALELA